MLEKIINDTLFGINNTDAVKAKMFLYSAHDITVASFLINLGVYERHLPVYGCYVTLEVHKIRNVYGIKVGKVNDRVAKQKFKVSFFVVAGILSRLHKNKTAFTYHSGL